MGFSDVFGLKQLQAVSGNKADKHGVRQNHELKVSIKLHQTEGNCRVEVINLCGLITKSSLFHMIYGHFINR